MSRLSYPSLVCIAGFLLAAATPEVCHTDKVSTEEDVTSLLQHSTAIQWNRERQAKKLQNRIARQTAKLDAAKKDPKGNRVVRAMLEKKLNDLKLYSEKRTARFQGQLDALDAPPAAPAAPAAGTRAEFFADRKKKKQAARKAYFADRAAKKAKGAKLFAEKRGKVKQAFADKLLQKKSKQAAQQKPAVDPAPAAELEETTSTKVDLTDTDSMKKALESLTTELKDSEMAQTEAAKHEAFQFVENAVKKVELRKQIAEIEAQLGTAKTGQDKKVPVQVPAPAKQSAAPKVPNPADGPKELSIEAVVAQSLSLQPPTMNGYR